jgi:hypothetical protein
MPDIPVYGYSGDDDIGDAPSTVMVEDQIYYSEKAVKNIESSARIDGFILCLITVPIATLVGFGIFELIKLIVE